MPDPMIAYCGPAPVPNDIWTRWNVDPLLLATLAALAFVDRVRDQDEWHVQPADFDDVEGKLGCKSVELVVAQDDVPGGLVQRRG